MYVCVSSARVKQNSLGGTTTARSRRNYIETELNFLLAAFACCDSARALAQNDTSLITVNARGRAVAYICANAQWRFSGRIYILRRRARGAEVAAIYKENQRYWENRSVSRAKCFPKKLVYVPRK